MRWIPSKNRVAEKGLSVTQAGFTLIELMIVIAIIGILAATAITSYTDYTARTKVSSGLTLASNAKLAVAERYSMNTDFPASNTEAGIPAGNTFTSEYVESVDISAVPTSGTITITYKGFSRVSAGDTLLLVPSAETIASVKWQCTSNTMDGKLLPSVCR
jgi:type IV pilus assembly protein PilA